MTDLPAGITSFTPMVVGYRRWNGAVWAPEQVEAYNRELERIQHWHSVGLNVQALVNGLYKLAMEFDYSDSH